MARFGALLLLAGCSIAKPCPDCPKKEREIARLERENQRLEEMIESLCSNSHRPSKPRQVLYGRLVAYSQVNKIAVINVGKDAGVLSGDTFTIFRGQSFVAKVVIDRADRAWSAGWMMEIRREPTVGDSAVSHALVLRE